MTWLPLCKLDIRQMKMTARSHPYTLIGMFIVHTMPEMIEMPGMPGMPGMPEMLEMPEMFEMPEIP